MIGGPALPPAGVVIELHDLVEAELLVVIGADPLGGVDGALFQGGVDVATRNLLRDAAELLQRLAGPAADAHLETLEVGRLLDLLVEPAAHLAAGVASEQTLEVELLAEVVDQFLAIAIIEPGVLLGGVEAERDCTEQRPGRVLADVVILRGMAHLDGAVLHRIEDLQSRHDLARRERLDLKLVIGRLGDVLGDGLAGAEQRIERFGPARRQPPFEGRHGLSDRRLGDGGGGDAGRGRLDELTTFHFGVSLCDLPRSSGRSFPRPAPVCSAADLRHHAPAGWQNPGGHWAIPCDLNAQTRESPGAWRPLFRRRASRMGSDTDGPANITPAAKETVRASGSAPPHHPRTMT